MTFKYFLVRPDWTHEVLDTGSVEQFLLTDRDEHLDPTGAARVKLNPAWMMSGWVRDCSLLPEAKQERNVPGGVLLAVLGAAQQPYAGNVVIAGWDERRAYAGNVEVVGLLDVQIQAMRDLLAGIRRALELDPVADAAVDEAAAPTDDPQWVADVRAFAAYVRNGAVEPIRVLHGEDALSYLEDRVRRTQ